MHPVRRQTSPHAACLRRERTDAEDKVWQALRNRQLDGFKFRFQASIYPYVADFLCVDAGLIVEIDGGQHDQDKDARRTAFLQAEGYRVVRFWNHDVVENSDGVIEAVCLGLLERTRAKKKTLTPPSPAKAGEG